MQQAVLPAPQLEVQVTPHGAGVSSVADVADLLARANSVTALDERRVAQVGVPVGASVEPAADDHLVAVQDGVVPAADHPAGARGRKRRATSGVDVKALVRPAAVAWRSEIADPSAIVVWPPDRVHVPAHDDLPRAGVARRVQVLVEALIDRFVGALAPDLAAAQKQRVIEQELGRFRFAWAGSLAPGQAHYFRVHGPVTLIEHDNTQNNANHIHSVWRDLAADFGSDALAEHYRRQPHR